MKSGNLRSLWIRWVIANGLGAVGGAVLSFVQWLVLRKSMQGAPIWIPANMLAWMVGMPIIFWGIDTAQRFNDLTSTIIFLGGVLLVTGLVVGAIHGAFLVRLAKPGLTSPKISLQDNHL